MKKVLKFGGTSLASASQIEKIHKIVELEKKDVVAVVVSAPGKREKGDIKITDLLIKFAKEKTEEALAPIYDRYREIETTLCDGKVEVADELKALLSSHIGKAPSLPGDEFYDAIVSRGEWTCAKIVARAFDYIFLDPIEFMCEDKKKENTIDYDKSSELLSKHKSDKILVIPGFYFRSVEGKIKLFCRGGSDITGSVVARCLSADVYENWTDVSGIYSADPRIVKEAQPIQTLSYRSLALMTKNGAEVFCSEAIAPIENRIALNVRNTNRPSDPGTIVKNDDSFSKSYKDDPIAVVENKDKKEIYVLSNIKGIVKTYSANDYSLEKVFKEAFT